MNITEKLVAALRAMVEMEDWDDVEAGDGSTVGTAKAVIAEYEAKPVGFTVCIQEKHNTETTHVTFQAAETPEQAIELAMEECRADWDEWDSEDEALMERDLHVLAVMRGDFDILEWNDQ